jgi:monofunctional biosynthetic peptidoglycan transglycosylase
MAAATEPSADAPGRDEAGGRPTAPLRRASRYAALVVLGALVAAALLVAWWWTPPSGLDGYAEGPPTTWSFREHQQEAWREEGIGREILWEYRPLERISLQLQLAALAGEDVNFFGHAGIDTEAIREALAEWRAGGRLRGASTVTQQLAKNLFLSNTRSWLRKLREARIAWWLERRLGKRRILELYLNVIEFDEGVLGVAAAARHYYERDVAALDRGTAAGLAAAIPAPTTANPRTATRGWQNRRAIILERMGAMEWLERRLQSLQ